MADRRFFKVAGPFTLAEIAAIAGAEIARGDPGLPLCDVAPLATAAEGELSFLDNRAYLRDFSESRASACLVASQHVDHAPAGMALLVTPRPYLGYALAAQAFYPERSTETGVATGAHVHPTARLGEGTAVAAGAVVGAGAEIGARGRIDANAVVGPGVRLGDDCYVGAGASVRYCLAGHRVRLLAGARIGEDGFGYAPGEGRHVRVPQLGRVILGDDVEVGANVTIDRGAGPDTVVGDGCIIDNLVHIAHNVRIGRRCVIVAQVGISGSTTLGDNVVIGGQGGLAGHIKVGDGVRIGGKAAVLHDIPPGETVLGIPAVPRRQYWRQVIALRNLASKKGKDE